MRCNCEHIRHFPVDELLWQAGFEQGHPYLMEVDEPGVGALYVGKVCAECARTCMKDYLLS